MFQNIVKNKCRVAKKLAHLYKIAFNISSGISWTFCDNKIFWLYSPHTASPCRSVKFGKINTVGLAGNAADALPQSPACARRHNVCNNLNSGK